MATDFSYNNTSITTSGGIKPSTTDTPADVRTRVELEADIAEIPNPFLGMIVYAKDTGKHYKITGLKDKKIGMATIQNAAVDTYEVLISESAGEQGPKGDKGDPGADGLTTAITVNGSTYEHVNGTITLPDYPSTNGFATLDYVNEMTGGKKQVYLTQAEYDILTDEQKNDNTTVYNIIDVNSTCNATFAFNTDGDLEVTIDGITKVFSPKA